MKISDVLWIAANENLSASCYVADPVQSTYSCQAVQLACEKLTRLSKVSWYNKRNPFYKTIDFLEELGVYTSGYCEFIEFVSGEKRQGARYLWLMFAYQVALSEGV